MAKKINLAWSQLTKEKGRFLVALAGIAFADILMFIQFGFQDALFDSAIKPHRSFRADLVLINPQMRTLFAVKSFPRERLQQTLAFDGVASVNPIYIASGQWRNPMTKMDRTILVWGIDPGRSPFNLPEVNQSLDQLKPLNNLLYDQAGRPEFGPVAQELKQTGKFETQLNEKNIRVQGLFSMGASFTADGNVIVSDSTFMQIFNNRKIDDIEVGLLTVKPNSDIPHLQRSLANFLPKDVQVLTPSQFAEIERTYWAEGTGIGFIFGIGAVMGFIVGIVIVYQILYSDVNDHLPEYATLKAMGYRDRYLLGTLMQEAMLLACFGFLPGFALAVGLYQLTFAATMLPIAMTVARATTVYLLTVVMCFISGAIAMRKLQAADPADIF
jgi:putative ABC transport system permease protein